MAGNATAVIISSAPTSMAAIEKAANSTARVEAMPRSVCPVRWRARSTGSSYLPYGLTWPPRHRSINRALYKSALVGPPIQPVPTPARIRTTIATITAPPEELRELRAYHKALADPTRLRILQRLAESPATVTELIAHVDLSQPLVCVAPAPLKAAGLVETRRQGREVICTLRRESSTASRAGERELLGLAG